MTTNETTNILVSDDVLEDLHALALEDYPTSYYAELYYNRTTGEVSSHLHASRNSWTNAAREDQDEVKITAGSGGLEVGERFLLPEEYEHDFENCFDELASDLPVPESYDPECDCLSDYYGREDIVRYLHDGRIKSDKDEDWAMLRAMWLPVIADAFALAGE